MPSHVRLCFGQPCSPCESGRFRRPSPHSAYTYTPSGASPAVIVSLSKVPPGFGPKQSRAVHPRELGKRRMRSSLPSGKSATSPARCIHRPQRDTSSSEYRLLVSRASVGASREPSPRRSPALIPHTCAVSPTFRYGAFLFVASALADSSSARLATCDRTRTSIRRYPTPNNSNWESRRLAGAIITSLSDNRAANLPRIITVQSRYRNI